mgnify:CR=1 FL=1
MLRAKRFILLSELLRKFGVECEYADNQFVVLLISPADKKEIFTKLRYSLKNALENVSAYTHDKDDFNIPVLKQIMSIRDAAFSASELIDVEKLPEIDAKTLSDACGIEDNWCIDGKYYSMTSTYLPFEGDMRVRFTIK